MALGLAQVITGGIDIRAVPEALTDFNTYTKIVGIPALPFVALVVVIIGGIVLHKTKFGRYTYAVGSNELGARRVGINVDRHLIASTPCPARSPASARSWLWPSSAPPPSPGSR